ncbi:MAG TPA: nuclear transport factor 2 family protein [Bacteroidales bacterium]|nr:nuclear transport factor 2 family protein [Bacteroidales bacterium]
MMKKTISVILLAVASVITMARQPGGFAPGIVKPSAAEDSIRNAALDYADGYYSGDAARMARAVHYDLNKAYPRYLARTGRVALSYTTYSALIGLTASKAGLLADTARHVRTVLLQVTPEIALVKVTSSRFNDYLQLVKLNGEWKIINVLWNSPQNTAWLKDLKPDQEKKEIEKAALAYMRGAQNGDAERLREYVSADFSRVSVFPTGTEGKSAIQRIRFSGLEENAFAGIGRQEESQKDNSVEVLDVMDGLAMVRLQSVTSVEYLQLYRDADHWKLFNSLQTARDDKHIDDLLPAIAGEPMPSFNLPVYGGGEYDLKDHLGKNILLMFPRGWLGNSWCLFCPYQYLDLAELEKKEQIRKKYNLEIVFVMPYSNERIADWFARFPESMNRMEGIKHPPADQGAPSEFSIWANAHYPKSFDLKDGIPSKTFPVLCDEKRTLSKRLKLFTEFWDNAQSEQNMAAIYLIDKTGTLRWKYVSQMTEDRPSTEFILKPLRS